MAILQDEEYRRFTKPAELHKAVNTLKGIVSGISSDGEIGDSEIQELINWCDLHRFLKNKHPFKELIPLIDEATKDGIIDHEEALDIIWVCNNILNDNDYYDAITSGIQQLHGLLHGIIADNQITDREIKNLQQWLNENDFLRTCYPYDEIDSILTGVLADGVVTDDERDMLMAYFSTFVNLKESYNLNEVQLEELRKSFNIRGLCAVDPYIKIDNSLFCVTGQSSRATRDEFAGVIFDMGGDFKNTVTKETQYLIVGNEGSPCWAFSCYGRKVEKAIDYRQKGSRIMIVHENDFWDVVR